MRAVKHGRGDRNADLEVLARHDDVVFFQRPDGLVVVVDALEHLFEGLRLVALTIGLERLADLAAQAAARPAEMGLENLAHIHAARHAERIEHDVDRGPVLEIRHVLDRHDLADHALVAVTAGHLVAGLDLALHRDEDLDHLHHARRQLVAALELVDLVDEALLEPLLGLFVLAADRLDLGHGLVVLERDLPPMAAHDVLKKRLGDLGVLLDALRSLGHDLVHQHVFQAAIDVAVENGELVVAVLGEPLDLLALDRHGALILLHTVAVEYAHLDHGAGNAWRQFERSIAHVGGLLAEDGAKQLLLWRHRALALGRYLAHEDVARIDLGADIDDARLVEILERLFRDVGNVAGDFLRAELGVARHHLEFLDMDRGEHVGADDALGDEDGILEVVAHPRHEGDEHVAAERKLAEIGRGTVGNDLPGLNLIADTHERPLIDTGVLVRALELAQIVDVHARFRRIGLLGRADDDTGRVHLIDHAGAAGADGRAGIARYDLLHAGADQRRLGGDKRHRLTLHVRAHQRAVGVVILEERNECRRDRHELLRRHVDEIDLLRRHQLDVAGMAADDQVLGERAVRRELGVGLGDDVARLLHGREIDHLVGHLGFDHAAIRAFDEAVFIHPGIGRERVDEADIRSFRRLDRADAAVMGRVHVAHLEAGALAREPARSERRQTPLMRDLRQRIGLVHELRQLRGAEELAHRGGGGLRVDQVLRHDRVDIDRAHALLDRALHAQQAHAVLILHQLADRAHPAVAEMVDVVDLALAVAEADQGLDHGEDVFLAQRAHRVGCIEIKPHVHLDPADGREVVTLGIEEDAVEQRRGGFRRRRLARTHHPVNVKQRLLGVRVLVNGERVADERADIDMIDVEDRDFLEVDLLQRGEQLGVEFLARLAIDLARLHVDDVLGEVAAMEILVADEKLFQALIGELLGEPRGDLAAGFDRDLAGLGVDQVARRLDAAQAIATERHAPAFLGCLQRDAVVERGENFLVLESERIEQRRHRQLAAPVYADIDDVFRVEFEIEPRAAIGNDARREQELA